MRIWSYWHRLEYFRLDRGARVLVHTEDVDDHGPCIGRGPEEFARLCAEEFLARQAAPAAGRWRVVLWRLDETGTRPVRRLCETELRWPGAPAEAAPEVVPGAEGAR
ncbi:MAG TPA: hypothetical protein VIL00_10185 [Pseudonocardiaceae bacterium]